MPADATTLEKQGRRRPETRRTEAQGGGPAEFSPKECSMLSGADELATPIGARVPDNTRRRLPTPEPSLGLPIRG